MDQRREPTRRRFTSRRGLEGEIVDRSDVSGMVDASNMRSMPAPSAKQLPHADDCLAGEWVEEVGPAACTCWKGQRTTLDTRALRNPTWSNIDAIGDLLDTAADEIDRLRAELAESQADAENGWKVAEQWERTASDVKAAADVFLDERNSLRVLIENAPHDAQCRTRWSIPRSDCTCWKADAIG